MKMRLSRGQIKSKERVTKHGEVFTNPREVKAMCDLVKEECERIDSLFLEPACGEGAFLIEILTRKLNTINNNNQKDWEHNSLIALSSLYGIDLLKDNVEICKKNLLELFMENYKNKFEVKEKVIEFAKTILNYNIINGNTLSQHLVDEKQNDLSDIITFSKWIWKGNNVLRVEFPFDELLNPQQSRFSQNKKVFSYAEVL